MSTSAQVIAKLEANGFKLQGNEWRGNSPFRNGSDSKGFTVRIEDDEHGAYTDHASGESGSLYELAAKFNIEIPRAKVETTKRAYTGLADYATAHGVEADVFRAAGWSEVIHNDRPALAFTTDTGTRYRYLDGKGSYTNVTGYKACWYGLKRAIARATELQLPIVLVNGEATTVAAQHYGFPACAVTNGERRYPEHLLDELKSKWSGGFILAFDCDDTGRRVAREIERQLAGRPVAVMDLGLTDGGDLADFCTVNNDDAWSNFWKRAPKPSVTSALEAITRDNAALLATALQELKTTIARGEAAKQAEDLTQQIAKSRALLDGLEAQHAAPKVRSIECIADEALAQLDKMYHADSKMLGLSWGFPLLDEITGGLQPATTNILYGATSMGKTTLAASIIRENLGVVPGLIIPTETQGKRYLFRLAASIAQIPSDKIASGELNEMEYTRVRQIIVSMKKLGWRFLEHPQPTRSMLRSTVLDAAAAGCKLVVIDSISRLASAGDYSATSEINNLIQSLAIESGLPFLLTSQVGRDTSERKDKTPKLTDAYGGGVIENNADFVLGLYRHDYYLAQYPDTVEPSELFPPGTASGQVLKNRNGSHMGAYVRFKYVGGAGFYPIGKPVILGGAS